MMSGTACFCMLAPMSARLASSCSTKGMSAVATEMICFGLDVHELDLVGLARSRSQRSCRDDLFAAPTRMPVPCGRGARARGRPDTPVGVDGRVGLRDDVGLLLVGGVEDDLVGHPPVGHLAVGRLDEAVLVDPRVGGEVADEADVRALGRLDRAHAAVVAGVHVTDLEAGALAREAARPEGGQPPLVGEPRQRVVLVHELAELAGGEELLDRGHDRSDVDEGLGRDRLDVLGAHALPDHALHARQPDADLVLDQLAHRADAAVGEVVLVVDAVGGLRVAHVLGEVQQVGRRREHLGRASVPWSARAARAARRTAPRSCRSRGRACGRACSGRRGEVVALVGEEGALEVLACRLDGLDLAGARALVDLEQGRVLGRGILLMYCPSPSEGLLLGPLRLEEVEVVDEALEEGVVEHRVEGAQQREQREAALARDAGACVDLLRGFASMSTSSHSPR